AAIGNLSRTIEVVRERERIMTKAVPLTEIWRGPIVESLHLGHAMICDHHGTLLHAWGDPDAIVYPRSSAKMLQALPLVESGAANDLSDERLALACASHQGAAIHTDAVHAWLADMGLTDDDLRCGLQMPQDRLAFNNLIKTDGKPCQAHNMCSGKHAGFIALAQHLEEPGNYVDVDHPVQKACLAVFEDLTEVKSPGYGLDGCTAPNFITTMHGMARAMGWFSAAREGNSARARAAARLVNAMYENPVLVAGEKRAATELMRACNERVALKDGAEGYFIAILPEQKLGVALKILDGSMRAANCAITTLLVRLGVLDPDHPTAKRFMNAPIRNKNKIEIGQIKPVDGLLA
ncbi:MAG: asparaginase, partial [Pseudomonadota bacterium]